MIFSRSHPHVSVVSKKWHFSLFESLFDLTSCLDNFTLLKAGPSATIIYNSVLDFSFNLFEIMACRLKRCIINEAQPDLWGLKKLDMCHRNIYQG